jgi:hypothetical protein
MCSVMRYLFRHGWKTQGPLHTLLGKQVLRLGCWGRGRKMPQNGLEDSNRDYLLESGPSGPPEVQWRCPFFELDGDFFGFF